MLLISSVKVSSVCTHQLKQFFSCSATSRVRKNKYSQFRVIRGCHVIQSPLGGAQKIAKRARVESKIPHSYHPELTVLLIYADFRGQMISKIISK